MIVKTILSVNELKKMALTKHNLLILTGVFVVLFIPHFLGNAYAESLTSKIWFVTSDEYGCSNLNYEAIKFIESLAIKYLVVYGIESGFFPPQCVYLNEIEQNPNILSDLMNTVELPILITDSEIESELFRKDMHDDHFQFLYYEKRHVVFCYCSIPAKDHTPGWQMSHQISHYVLDRLDESKTVSIDWVHDAEETSKNCVNIRRQPALCHELWTPIVGNIAKEIITVKVHPDYYTNSTFGKSTEDLSKYRKEIPIKINNHPNEHDNNNPNLEETNLIIINFRNSMFNGNQPIVFSGKLTTSFGKSIPHAEILIKTEEMCPPNGIIAKGETDKHGRFKIYTLAQVWDTDDDGMIKVQAVYDGNSKYQYSTSNPQIIVVYPLNAQNCMFVNGM